MFHSHTLVCKLPRSCTISLHLETYDYVIVKQYCPVANFSRPPPTGSLLRKVVYGHLAVEGPNKVLNTALTWNESHFTKKSDMQKKKNHRRCL
jgi:hypothetical protein